MQTPLTLSLRFLALIFLFQLALPRTAHAQYAIQPEQMVEIDTLTDMIKGNLPFDRPFFLKVNFKGREDFISGQYYKVDADGSLMTLTKRELNSQHKLQRDSGVDLTTPDDKGPFTLEQPKLKGTKANSNIIFTVPALEPNERYEFLVAAKPTAAELSFLYATSLLALTAREKAAANFQAFAEKKKAGVPARVLSNQGPFPTSQEFLKFVKDSLTTRLEEIKELEKSLDASILKGQGTATQFKGLASLQALVQQATTCRCADQAHHTFVCQQLTSLLLPAASLYQGDLASITELANGRRTFSASANTESAEPGAYAARATNLKATITALDSLVIYTSLLQLEGIQADAMKLLRTNLQALQKNFLSYATDLKKLQKKKDAVVSTIKANPSFSNVRTLYGAASHIYSFQTRNKLRITPDVGLIGYGNVDIASRSIGAFRGVAPFIGFHVNFRYIDKDIPFKLLQHKSPAHRLSAHMGWTLVSISDTRTRADFFDKSSLLTGLGFRLTSELRFIAGGLWFRQFDTNPLIERRTVAVAPYAGLSIDFELTEFLKNVTDVFKK